MNQPTSAPSAKVLAATLAAAVAVIIIYVIEAAAGIDLPQAVEAAIVVILTFAAGYLKTEGSDS